LSLSLPLHSQVPLTSASGINLHPGGEDDGWPAPPPVVLKDGSFVQLLKDGEALLAAYDAISMARDLICLEVYIFASDLTGRTFADLLCKKASEGLRVFVTYDSVGCIWTDRAIFRRMQRCGVRVAEFHPIRPWDGRFSWRPFNRDHRKLLVVDRQIAWLGGLNIADEYGGPWVAGPEAMEKVAPWRDTAIGLRGPATEHLFTAFRKTWHYLKHGGRIKRCEHLVDGTQNGGDMDVLGSVAYRNSPLRNRFIRAVRAATRTIDLTMAYFAPDDDLVSELCKAAKRGVKVRLMLPSMSDLHILVVAARSFYERLLSAGVQIYERQHAILHAKTMVIDARFGVVGSTNLDYRSIEYNCEISVAVDSEAFGRQMVSLFENDVKFANKIQAKAWRRRPVRDRIGQWMVSRARYLL
jgi:cardiolipin synthase A/B